jgi:dTDP-4-dehydrorhamnose reductase
VRAGWMMGGGPEKDKKFINKIYKQLAAGSKSLKVVDDKQGTPTYTVDFAKGLRALSETKFYGVYNQSCEGSCSRFDVAKEFVRLLGLTDVEIRKVKSDFFHDEYFAPRPASESLNCLKLKARNLYKMRDWKAALAVYAEDFRIVTR